MNIKLQNKFQLLKQILIPMHRVVIAFSGGTDSTLLLKVARTVLGKKNVLAITANSATYPVSELTAARQLARVLDVKHKVINTDELANRKFTRNPVTRCYYCKSELFSKLIILAKQEGYNYVLDGTNYDDLADYRPGRRAAKEKSVHSPLAESKLNKQEIRYLSKTLNLSTWDKPAYACLASRIPYRTTIKENILKRVDTAEQYIVKLGLPQVRVRTYRNIARIEVPVEFIPKLIKRRRQIITKLKSIGYQYIALDLEGYRTGSMNVAIK